MKIGVIDLGTNTFHLLIVESSDKGMQEVYRERIFVQLAEQGIQKIGIAPFQRALDALQHYKSILDQHQVDAVKAFGTAGLRTASNGQDLIEKVARLTDIQVQLISGDEEARLIHKGVQQAIALNQSNSLIMDIGGGSVEFILANKKQVHWAKSFPIGVAVLYNQFHKNDPITSTEITTLRKFLHKELEDLKTALQQFPSTQLVGASGTFDVLEKVLQIERLSPIHSSVPVKNFHPFYKEVLFTTLQERLDIQSIPNSRAQLIIVALILIDVIIEIAKIEQIDISAYAMKEGMIAELIAASSS